ncbi:thiamine biosynthesis protein ThiS [Arenivirga flava]|uniref:Thiamine biosynthesis protein ThiS n=1 Tax=Arenivirga flava TaxID=1930060 RepID=A0AA37UKZ7_9MICO|nr:thiamine biosynthesis protein ThiS [Arenivirga flava]
MLIHARFFAAARDAAGAESLELRPADPTIAGLLAAVGSTHPEGGRILGRCSFLVNGRSTTDRAHPLADGDRVDVLPPFAGG